MSKKHEFDLDDEDNKIYRCSVCGATGKLNELLLTECNSHYDDIKRDPFDFIFMGFKPTLSEDDMGPLDGI